MEIKGTLVTQYTHPNLWNTVQQCSVKSGVHFNEILHVIRDTATGMHLETTIGASSREKVLLLGARGLKTLGYNNDSQIPPELEAAIYHEMAHLKHNDGTKVLIGKVTPLAGLTVGLVAMRMIERHQEKKKESEAFATIPPDLPPEEMKEWKEAHKKMNTKTLGDQILRTAKYVAAGALGLGAGYAVKAMIHHRMEYRADKFAAEMMGSPDAIISAVKKIENSFPEILAEYYPHMSEARKKVVNFMSAILHPSLEKRTTRLSGMSF